MITTASKYSLSEFTVSSDERIKNSAKGKVLSIPIPKEEIAWETLGVSGHGSYYLIREGIITKETEVPLLSFDSELGTIARYPNEGYMTVSEVINAGDNPGRWNEDENSMYYVPPEERNKGVMQFKTAYSGISEWENAENAIVDGYWYYEWTDLALPIDSITDGVIKTKYPSAFSVKEGNRFYIYNLLEELDEPGEWYYDEVSQTLFVYPPENCQYVRLNTKEYDAIKINGVSNITIDGIHIDGVKGNGIYASDSSGVKIINTVVSNVSKEGIYISRGQNNLVKSCSVYNIGNGAVTVSGGNLQTLAPANHVVDSCDIHDFGLIKKTYSGGVSLGGVGNALKNSKIYNANHLAVNYYGNDHLIDNNEIYNVLQNVSDSGAVYAGRSMVQRGTVISNNYIHDISSTAEDTVNAAGCVAIYLDDQYCGQTIINNRIENINGIGVFINGGRDNTVTGNSFSDVSVAGVRLDATGRAVNMNNGVINLEIYGLDGTYPFTGEAYSKYPHMINILEDNPLDPKYNIIKNNIYQNINLNVDIRPLTSAGSTITEEDMKAINTIEE